MKYVILAGGSGSRLWPLSRKLFAKQFLNLISDKSMLQETVLRVSKENGKDVYIISNKDSKFIINDQIKSVLPDFGKNNLIIEPVGRNTAPAIAYGSAFFEEDDVIAILSSDHFIRNPEQFNAVLDQAEKIAKEDYIVTLGIKPDSPKTGYGYIKRPKPKSKMVLLLKNSLKSQIFLKQRNMLKMVTISGTREFLFSKLDFS